MKKRRLLDNRTFTIPKDFHITTQSEYEASFVEPEIGMVKDTPFRYMIRNIKWEISEAHTAFVHLFYAIFWEIRRYRYTRSQN